MVVLLCWVWSLEMVVVLNGPAPKNILALHVNKLKVQLEVFLGIYNIYTYVCINYT